MYKPASKEEDMNKIRSGAGTEDNYCHQLCYCTLSRRCLAETFRQGQEAVRSNQPSSPSLNLEHANYTMQLSSMQTILACVSYQSIYQFILFLYRNYWNTLPKYYIVNYAVFP